MKNGSVKTLARAAMFSVFVFLGTLLSIPTPAGGNLNFGDGMLLFAASSLGLPFAVPVAVLGSGLADLSAGYLIYLPATVLIKSLMSLLFLFLQHVLQKSNLSPWKIRIFAALPTELFMTVGYYLYECFLLKSAVAPLINVPLNLLQGAFAVLVFSFAEKVGNRK